MALVRVMVDGTEFRREVGSRLVIGRDVECDVQVNDPKISRLHCLIERKGEDYVAVDLDSHNGTMISGWPLTRQTLKHGDVLTVGAASLQFLVEASNKAAKEAELALREEAADRPAPRPLGAKRQASLWEHAMHASQKNQPKSRKRKRVKPEVLRKQLFEQKKLTAAGFEEPVHIVKPAGSMPWYYKTIPLKVGLPASVALLALIYMLANGVPSLNFNSAKNHPPKSLPHSSPYNND